MDRQFDMPYGSWGKKKGRELIQMRLDLVEEERKRNGGRLSPAGSKEKQKYEVKRTVRAVLRNLRKPPMVSMTRCGELSVEQLEEIRVDARVANDRHYGWQRGIRMSKAK